MQTQALKSQIETAATGFFTIVSGDQKRVFQVFDEMLIGRDPNCEVVLEDPYVSLRHARVFRYRGLFAIRDLKSRNGLVVNGTHVLESQLNDQDRIKIGQTELLFSIERANDNDDPLLKSKNQKWHDQLIRLPFVARSNHPVLILGPSGSGKEVLASSIHRLSPRSSGPFLSVNCSALTESLAESELFGHVKGSFTGALSDRKGAFEAARGGTLFLDEIGDLPLAMQPKLLRALENSETKAVGSDKTAPTDVRIVAATNHNLKEKVKCGQFREDLYFRLQILQINPPALKDRKEDFDDLLAAFCMLNRVRFDWLATERLRAYGWPGNIRELKNMVLRASALFPHREITTNELPTIMADSEKVDNLTEAAAFPQSQVIANPDKKNPSDETAAKLALAEKPTAKNLVQAFEKDLIIRRLIANAGNQRRTAAELGIPKSTLYDRIKLYGIEPEVFKSRVWRPRV
jgi:DNA-binding NtrC family response regulator